MKLTASNIVSSINQLDKNVLYNYLNPRNRGRIQIVGVDMPEGPIRIKRWTPAPGLNLDNVKVESISTELIWRIANAFTPGQPINFDRLLAGSYNTRSVLEALLAYTPEFYFCYPGRIETTGGNPKVKKGHKHLMWKPENPHRIGVPQQIKTDIIISEVPIQDVAYEAITLPETAGATELDINILRRHTQMQICLYFIGKQLNYRTWIAANDKGIVYENKRLEEYDGVIASLKNEKIMTQFDEAIQAAKLIDCIWFKNGKLMPAVMEVEHSTGVTSGLTRMQNFKNNFIPNLPTRYVIVAADEERDRVIREASKEQFRDLNARYFPYSAVEELYALCQRRKIKGVTEEFLDCYMEPVLMS